MADVPFRTVVGLEVHVQLLTKTKLFCACHTDFGLPPNSATCPVCLGLPGALPVMNRRAIDLALRGALALNAEIPGFTKWDRKNYFYPDLPKGYQISQYDLPLSRNGWLEIASGEGPKRIGIIRAHLEEDAGKMLHDEKGGGNDSLIDLNRAGTPLLEIVTQPDISSPEEAKIFLEELRLLLRETGVSDCEMQEGSLRCDANVNIQVADSSRKMAATPLVEIKNLNSFRAVERAIRFESRRQFEELQVNPGYLFGKVPKATRGWDEHRAITWEQRRKEEAADYRYFPEPDLVPVVAAKDWLDQARAALGELPAAARERLTRQYGLSPYDAEVLTSQGRPLVAYFEETTRIAGDAKAAANWLTNQVLAFLKERKMELADFPLSAAKLGELIAEQKTRGLGKQAAIEVFLRMVDKGESAPESIVALKLGEAASSDDLREIVRRAIAANPKAAADFKNGKLQAANAIKGAVMRETRGAARSEAVDQVLREELANV
jgi:aspartyl-tRNA(Asn)/glutamyl-tRNA(Gln) amidotransferase subunit B